MLRKIRTAWNRDLEDWDMEKADPNSETVPEQTMTLRTILTRHASGLPMDAPPVKFFNEDEDSDPDETFDTVNFKKLDLADQQAIREEHALYVKHLQNSMRSKMLNRKPKPEQPQDDDEEQPTPPKPKPKPKPKDSEKED